MKNLTKEEVIETLRKKTEELYDLVEDISKNTEFNPCLISLVGLDKGDGMNLFSNAVIGNEISLGFMLSMADDLGGPLSVAQLIDLLENKKD
ncbi:DUF2482 family protein [Staphylococcus coagulans]|uniref:DUF2482 family protein n=1 Tax=Staphylococcus coagulans TaxID=74706 RepID=UPI000679FB8E|nr:hypothetical protein NP71_06745 [Staphylococcus schleiferi]